MEAILSDVGTRCSFGYKNGVLKVVSIGVASTLQLPERYCEGRSSLPPSAGQFVTEFMDNLFELEELYYKTIPNDIRNTDKLRNICCMPVFGSGSFERAFTLTAFQGEVP